MKLNQEKVLFVDDDTELLGVISTLLRGWGHEVVTCTSATEALDYLNEESPDLILSDIMMPGKDGYNFLQEIQASPGTASIPFVFITANSCKDVSLKARRLGCDDFLAKPFEPDELQAIIEGKLKSAKLREQTSSQKKLLQTLSHEFRTPLVAINTGADLLVDSTDMMSADIAKKVVGSIKRGGQRLNRLVEDFVTMQRLESGLEAKNQEALFSKESVNSLSQEAIESFQAHLDELGTARQIEFIPLSKDFDIKVCRPQVISSLMRLIDNAHKFSPPDEPVLVRLEDAEEKIVFSIEDNGVGLEKEHWKDAIKAFSQINREHQEQQGAGLGLAIVKEFVKLNRGTLWLDEAPRERGVAIKLAFSKLYY